MKRSLDDLKFKTKDGEKFDIPLEGSLGLLALGDIGLLAWRNKRAKYIQSIVDRKKNKENEGIDGEEK